MYTRVRQGYREKGEEKHHEWMDCLFIRTCDLLFLFVLLMFIYYIA